MQKKDDVMVSLILIILGGWVIFGAIKLRVGSITDPSTGFFPFLGGALLIIFSLILLLQALKGHSLAGKPFGEIRQPAILVGGMVVYIGIFDWVGYVIATMILSGIILYILKSKSVWIATVISIGISVGSYLLFDRLLGVSLPSGFLKYFL